MASKLKLTVGVCFVTFVTLLYFVTPGESQEGEDVLKDQRGIDQAVCSQGEDKILTVQYDFMNGPVLCGQDVPLGLFHSRPPSVKYEHAEKGSRYLLAMVDPDAPSAKNPQMKYWRHWLVTFISGDDLQKGIRSKDWGSTGFGNILTTYEPPTPPPGSGRHRYQFLLFLEPPTHPIILTQEQQKHRGKFDLQAFLLEMKFETLVAATEFVTENAGDRDEL
ncbi:PEBP4 [Branchiostoma lanceolatum]|uniref:PEBP4 protein n=1 Tax=Branchiostoma lanceolatum TaxID=7740 RepID=A0A8K0EN37_BRALA|nr:PEBP4 [Branchiostoma lanceolatum]